MAPRFGGGSLFYLSSRGAGDGLWRYRDGQPLEIWKGSEGALMEPTALSPDGSKATLILRRNGKRRLNVISTDGAELQPLAEAIYVQGTASWSPDSKWIVTGGYEAGKPGLFRIAVDGTAVQRILSKLAFNPAWSPDGNLIVYGGPGVATGTSLGHTPRWKANRFRSPAPEFRYRADRSSGSRKNHYW